MKNIKYKRNNPYRQDYYDLEEEELVFEATQPAKDTTPTNPSYSRDMGKGTLINSRKWHRLKKINKWLDKEQRTSSDCEGYFDILMNDFLISNELKALIKKDVMITTPQNIYDTIAATFKSIERNNHPITTTEFREAVKKNFTIGREFSPKMYSKVRDYTWYINRVLSNIDLNPEQYNKIFKKTTENFKKLQPIIQGDPTSLIGILCRLGVISLKLERDIPPLKTFFISGNTYGIYREMFRKLGITIPKHIRTRPNTFDRETYHKEYYKVNREEIREKQKLYREGKKVKNK